MLKIIDLGKTEYQEALKIQRDFFLKKRKNPEIGDIILITEHYPVYTRGKSTKREHIPDNLDAPIFEIERGGSVTFHGEGQIIVYPILRLKKNLSVKKFVYILEEIMIETLKEFGIRGFRKEKFRGVFTERGKIGFVGIKISKGISMHGFSLNVNVDKSYFSKIIPCGIKDIPVCNMADFIPGVKTIYVKNILISSILKKGRRKLL
ncbi:lipoyl(octanoyl) transferase LipB [Persephonella sp.]